MAKLEITPFLAYFSFLWTFRGYFGRIIFLGGSDIFFLIGGSAYFWAVMRHTCGENGDYPFFLAKIPFLWILEAFGRIIFCGGVRYFICDRWGRIMIGNDEAHM